MSSKEHKIMVRTALLLALTLLLQSMRFILPVPVFFSTLLIGSLVNACLLIALKTTSLYAAIIIAVMTPLVAYFQQLLPLPVFIPPVAFANIIYIVLFKAVSPRGRWLGAATASLAKTAFLFAVFTWLLGWIQINPKLAAGLLLVMGWPQLFTALAGAFLAMIVVKRLQKIGAA